MNFNEEIVSFISDKLGGVAIIDDGSSEIVYADSYFKDKYGADIVGMDADSVFLWTGDCPALSRDSAPTEWEYIDIDSKRYFKFNSALFEKAGRMYRIHFVTDITGYMGLNRDVTKYMIFFKKLSGFQTAVLEKLSDTYYELLPMLAGYFKTSRIHFFIQRDSSLDIITYNKLENSYSNDRVSVDDDMERIFTDNGREGTYEEKFSGSVIEALSSEGIKPEGSYVMLVSGEISNQRYAVYLSAWPNMEWTSINEHALKSVIKLYIENGIMRDKLVYESEHDGLTGLYNKNKFLSMSQDDFANRKSVAVFYFDVNNLKRINDELGHDAGDRLIIKAANSIRRITNNRVYGFRMGGDEFLAVATDVTSDEAVSIKEKWERELARLNCADDGIECVVAVGLACGSGEYDFDTLLKRADALMYEDKKKKKRAGEEIR